MLFKLIFQHSLILILRLYAIETPLIRELILLILLCDCITLRLEREKLKTDYGDRPCFNYLLPYFSLSISLMSCPAA